MLKQSVFYRVSLLLVLSKFTDTLEVFSSLVSIEKCNNSELVHKQTVHTVSDKSVVLYKDSKLRREEEKVGDIEGVLAYILTLDRLNKVC